MPRAGWCRECGEWIWVDEDGSCQNGHGPECVGGIYEAKPQQPAASPEASFGVGEMPADLYRFSWAAFTLPFFWAITYGVWPIILWWCVSLLVPVILTSAMGFDPKTGTASALIFITVISEAINGIIRLWAGANGNTLLWRREALRLSALPGAAPRFSVARFKARQRIWVIVGWVVLVSALIAAIVVNYVNWSEYGLGIGGAIEPLVFMGAEVWLGVWLSLKMVEERPGVPGPAEEATEHP